jgi:ATP-dependent RNA helicase RhlE
MRALANFKKGATRVLVASDIAARGLDVDDISHVINYDLPNVAETYVHRIGRTGRAGASGQAISFCSEEQRDDLREIERLLGRSIPVLHHSIKAQPPQPGQQPAHGQQQQRQRQAPARHDHSAQAAHKSASPQKQKDDFWRSRRKQGSAGWSKPRFKRRGR